jgi:hypothetical protein
VGDELLPLVVQAEAIGDRRALLPLGQLTKRTGCGPSGTRDCYECLRDEEILAMAIEGARRRPAPTTPWR